MTFDWRQSLPQIRDWLQPSAARRFVALEWDNREARVAVATVRSPGLLVEQVFSVPLAPRGDGPINEEQVGQTLAEALAARGVRRADALVAVGRGSIELKQLSLPPAPDDELAAMVRWQAQRDFHSLGEDWPLDFLTLAAAPDQPRTVLAAALPPEQLWHVAAICRTANL